MAGGGPLIDIGVHVLDYALHLFGEPRVTAVSAVTHSELGVRGRGGAAGNKQDVGSAYEVEDLASLLLRLEGGGSIVLETSWAAYRPAGDEFGITLYGTEGGADLRVVDYAPAGELTIFTGEGESISDVIGEGRPRARSHRRRRDVPRARRRSRRTGAATTARLALDRARVIDAAYESARIGAEVVLHPPTGAAPSDGDPGTPASGTASKGA